MYSPNNHSDQIYATFVSVRNTELTAYWTRYNILAAINIALLAVALSAEPSSLIRKYPCLVVIFGSVLALIWLCISIKGKQLFVKLWEVHIRDYEKKFTDKQSQLFTKVHEANEAKKSFKKHCDNLNILTKAIPIICMIGWLFIGIFFMNLSNVPQETELVITKEKLFKESNRQSIKIDELRADFSELTKEVSRLGALVNKYENTPKATEPSNSGDGNKRRRFIDN